MKRPSTQSSVFSNLFALLQSKAWARTFVLLFCAVQVVAPAWHTHEDGGLTCQASIVSAVKSHSPHALCNPDSIHAEEKVSSVSSLVSQGHGSDDFCLACLLSVMPMQAVSALQLQVEQVETRLAPPLVLASRSSFSMPQPPARGPPVLV